MSISLRMARRRFDPRTTTGRETWDHILDESELADMLHWAEDCVYLSFDVLWLLCSAGKMAESVLLLIG